MLGEHAFRLVMLRGDDKAEQRKVGRAIKRAPLHWLFVRWVYVRKFPDIPSKKLRGKRPRFYELNVINLDFFAPVAHAWFAAMLDEEAFASRRA